MEQIKKSISADPVTGFSRVGIHENFVITPNLNMVQQIRVITLHANGECMTDIISADESLTPYQRQAALSRYADQIVTRQTEGAFVTQMGVVVDEDFPEAIPQRDYFQAITLGALKSMGVNITDSTSVAELIYLLIGKEILATDQRGGL